MLPQPMQFKEFVAVLIDELIRDAVEHDRPVEEIFAKLAVESLELATRIHVQRGGSDTQFMWTAAHLLDHVRTSAPDQ